MTSKGKREEKKAVKKTEAMVSSHVGNYETHPFFIKKAKKAKDFLKASGLPKQLVNKPA